jgi:hypothetical protein
MCLPSCTQSDLYARLCMLAALAEVSKAASATHLEGAQGWGLEPQGHPSCMDAGVIEYWRGPPFLSMHPSLSPCVCCPCLLTLCSMGFFVGASRVKLPPGIAPPTLPQGRREALLTAKPSRSFFPRGFLTTCVLLSLFCLVSCSMGYFVGASCVKFPWRHSPTPPQGRHSGMDPSGAEYRREVLFLSPPPLQQTLEHMPFSAHPRPLCLTVSPVAAWATLSEPRA